MKKFTTLLMLLCVITFSTTSIQAQEAETTDTENVEGTDDGATENGAEEASSEESEGEDDAKKDDTKKARGSHKTIKDKFIEGGPGFMALPLLCLILGLAIVIERIVSLFFMSINTDKFVSSVNDAVSKNDIEGAKEICRNTRGPIASIFYQGLDRSNQGSIEVVEKAVVSYGSVQMGKLEKGLVWISLFIALAPMLGFMGTVIGMIDAFDKIEQAGDIQPKLVASGIKIALLTTVAGLIVAIILQLFYNYLVSKIDSIVNQMEESSISLVDMLVKNKIVKS